MVPCRKKNLKEKSLFSFFFPLKYRERNTGCKLLCNTLIDGDWKTTREETYLFLGSPLVGSPTNRIVLFHIRYPLKKETKYCQIILSF